MKKTLILVWLIVTVLLIGCSRNDESGREINPEAIGHYQRGRTHYAKEEFSESEEAFKAALKVSPRFANAAYMLVQDQGTFFELGLGWTSGSSQSHPK